jgi:hypothetical protein
MSPDTASSFAAKMKDDPTVKEYNEKKEESMRLAVEEAFEDPDVGKRWQTILGLLNDRHLDGVKVASFNGQIPGQDRHGPIRTLITPVHLAVLDGNVEAIKKFADYKCDIDKVPVLHLPFDSRPDRKYNSPTQLTAVSVHTPLRFAMTLPPPGKALDFYVGSARVLLQCGAKPEGCLHLAACAGNLYTSQQHNEGPEKQIRKQRVG